MRMKMDFYKFFGYLSWLNYILWLLELNVVILAVNLPLLLVLLVMESGIWTFPAVFAAGITIGPSILAAFDAMPHIEDGVVGFFFRSLAGKWKQCLRIWVPVWFLAVFLLADIYILQTYEVMNILKWVMLMALLGLVSFLLSFFMVWSAWNQDAKAAAALTLKLSFVKPFRFHMGILIICGTITLLGMKQIYLVLYGVSLGLFLVYKNFQPVIQYVNERPENRGFKQGDANGETKSE